MPSDPRHDILFEPVRIGPVTARNRFYQVPHCNGMGHRDPTPLAFMRGVKAEGGWAVVCTEEVEIHPSSEVVAVRRGPALGRRATSRPSRGWSRRCTSTARWPGSSCATTASHGANLYSRLAPMTVGHMPVVGHDPVQARRMDSRDIGDLRRRHRAAVRRALDAGFDLVYVYAGHGLNAIGQFLDPRLNQRTDGYGGAAREPRSAAARGARGHRGRGRRPGRRRLPDHGRRARRRRRLRPGRHRGGPRARRRAARPVGLLRSASGRTTRSRRASPTRAPRRRTSAASSS